MDILRMLIIAILISGTVYLFVLTRHFIQIFGKTIIGSLFRYLILGWSISIFVLGIVFLYYPVFFDRFGMVIILFLWTVSLYTLINILLTGIHRASQILKILQANERDLLKEIVDHAPIGIYTINNRGIIDSFNPKMVELFGVNNADEAIGLDALSYPLYKNVGLDVYLRSGLEGKAFETEVHFASGDGKKERWRHYRGVPLYSINGVTVARLLLMVTDITSQKELQNQLVQDAKELDLEVQKRTQNLEMLSAQYKSVIEGSLIGFYVLQDDVFKYVNQVFLSIFGYNTSDELINKSWHVVIPDEEIPFIIKNGLEDRMAGKGNSTRYSFRGKRKDGTLIEVETLSSPSTFEGKPAVIGSLQNVTDRTRMEKVIQDHVTELETTNKLMVNRELKMVELKEQIAGLREQLANRTS